MTPTAVLAVTFAVGHEPPGQQPQWNGGLPEPNAVRADAGRDSPERHWAPPEATPGVPPTARQRLLQLTWTALALCIQQLTNGSVSS